MQETKFDADGNVCEILAPWGPAWVQRLAKDAAIVYVQARSHSNFTNSLEGISIGPQSNIRLIIDH